MVNHLNALENVQLPLELKGVSTYQAAIQAKVWLEKVGLGERITSMPATLSGGEQQRVALARAFLYKPRWAWEAAGVLGGKVAANPRYWRCLPKEAQDVFLDIHMGQR